MSCGLISIVTIRVSTRMSLSTNGIKIISPGPRTPANRPNRNTTPLSHSGRIFNHGFIPLGRGKYRTQTYQSPCYFSSLGFTFKVSFSFLRLQQSAPSKLVSHWKTSNFTSKLYTPRGAFFFITVTQASSPDTS